MGYVESDSKRRRRESMNSRVFASDTKPVVIAARRSFNVPSQASGSTWEARGDYGTQESFIEYLRDIHDIPHSATELYSYDAERGLGEVRFEWWEVSLRIHQNEKPLRLR
jgi:hypothetical protein